MGASTPRSLSSLCLYARSLRNTSRNVSTYSAGGWARNSDGPREPREDRGDPVSYTPHGGRSGGDREGYGGGNRGGYGGQRSQPRDRSNVGESGGDRRPYTPRGSYTPRDRGGRGSFTPRGDWHGGDRGGYRGNQGGDRNYRSSGDRWQDRRQRDNAPEPVKRKIVPDTIAPQLSPAELNSVFSQELFVFRCDVTATQIPAAMQSYKHLSELGVLTTDDISNLARQIHARFRVDQVKEDVLPHIKTLIEDFKAHKIPGHPLAAVHLISCLKEMEQYSEFEQYWAWVQQQDENFCDARTYGAAIECLAYQATPLATLEFLWGEAISRYSTTVVPSVAMTSGRGVPVMLLQGIITARLFHGNWRAAYEALDICIRLYPTLTPPRIYELFVYERPVREAYIVFLLACRAGTPPRSSVLTPLMKEVWLKTGDVRAVLRLVYTWVAAGGTPDPIHLNSLIGAVLGSFPSQLAKDDPTYEPRLQATFEAIRNLIQAFTSMGVSLRHGAFNTVISIGGKLKLPELVHTGFEELLKAGLSPNEVTYRTLLNAVADMKDVDLLESSWEMLKQGQRGSRRRWDLMDFKSFTRAAISCGKEDYFQRELEALKHELGPTMFSGVRTAFLRATQSGGERKPDKREPVPIDKETLQKEVLTLTQIFSSGTIGDFTKTDTEALFNITPDQNPRGAKATPEQEEELKEIYTRLCGSGTSSAYKKSAVSAAANAIADVEPGTSITGFSIDQLRWENWKAINRLLFEAEVFDLEAEAEAEKKTIDASQGQIVTALKELKDNKKPRNIGYEFTFWNEETAKARIKQSVEEVVQLRKEGTEGWKVREMQVRGRLVPVEE
jgi:hypothetical protein